MIVIAIDPGTKKSAYVVMNSETEEILDAEITENELINNRITYLKEIYDFDFVIEMIASYGMAVSATVFETCVWIGKFIGHGEKLIGKEKCSRMYRRDVKLNLCGQTKAKDANVRRAIIDRYPAVGGGKIPQIGIKNDPGPLYGVSKDLWAAIGVGLTYIDAIDGKYTLTPIKFA